MTVIGLATDPANGGITWEQAETNLDQPLMLRRVFDPSPPAPYSKSGLGREGGNWCVYSFNCDDWAGLAAGKYDVAVSSFLASVPWYVSLDLVVAHEPEDNFGAQAWDWRWAQRRIHGLVDIANQGRGPTAHKIRFGGVLMAWTAMKSDRDKWATPSAWDFLAFDGYAWPDKRRSAADIFGPALDWCDRLDIPFAVAEFGVADNHPHRAKWIRQARRWFEANDVPWACYYNNGPWALTTGKQWAALA